MRHSLFALLIIPPLILLLSGCYYDVESQLYPAGGTTCDTTNITYSVTIRNILQNNSCLSCHSGSAVSGGNVVLDNYTALIVYAQNGKLYGSINHDAGYVPMPQGGNKISTCDLIRVRIWINNGMLNN